MELYGYRYLTKVVLLKREHFTLGFFGKLYELQFLSPYFIFSFRESFASVYRAGDTHIGVWQYAQKD
jgi:hypothetical protein